MDQDFDADRNATESADKRSYYQLDSAGNVIGLVNDTGNLFEAYAYDAFGNVTIFLPNTTTGQVNVNWNGTDTVSTQLYDTDTSPHPYSPAGNLWYFTGRQYDPEIGSFNYRARQYHPTLGQFMTLDPSGPWADSVSLGNPYAYVGNNPGTWRDPTGQYVDLVVEAASIGIGVYEVGNDISEGDWWGLAGSGGALVLDVGLAFVPGVPGVSSAGLKAVRAANNAGDARGVVRTADAVSDVRRTADDALDTTRALDNANGLKHGEDIGSPRALRGANEAGGQSRGIGEAINRLPDDAVVCRGGSCTARKFTEGAEGSMDGRLYGVSVNSAPGKGVAELSPPRFERVGATTVGKIRALGGDVQSQPTRWNPDHCSVCGLTAEELEGLFRPTMLNPKR